MSHSILNRNTQFTSSMSSRKSSGGESLPIRDRYIPSFTESPANMISKIDSSYDPKYKNTFNKWHKEPKIPIQMNSSTLIRMKTNSNNTGLETVVKKETGNQLTLNAMSFLKRDRRMSDYINKKYEETSKGMLPFDNSSYIKNVFLKVISAGDSALLLEKKSQASTYPSGDACHQGSYHRVSALSINDLKSGCNLKYFEEVSFQSKKSADLKVKIIKENDVPVNDTTSKIEDLRVSKLHREVEVEHFDSAKKLLEFGDGDGYEEEGIRLAIVKKNLRKNKKPVVITCLKNSSVKFVNKKK